MRPFFLLLPAGVLLAPADAPQARSPVQADTARDSVAVRVDGRLVGRPGLSCPMPVARGNQAVVMPNLRPPSLPDTAAPSGDLPRQERLKILLALPSRARDAMPVMRSGCVNPLFEQGRGRDSLRQR